MKRILISVTTPVILVLILVCTISAQNSQLGYPYERSAGRVLYVSPQGYLDTAKFKPIYKTMAEAFKNVRRGDTIMLYGKLRESNLVTPVDISDVTIMGMGTKVRPGNTTSPNKLMGGAADWGKDNEVGNKPLLTIGSSGWTIQDIHFGGSSTGSTIILERNGNNQTANHTIFSGDVFSGGLRGIDDHGGSASVSIYNCLFYGYNTAIASTSASQALPLMWEIINNRFVENATHIKLPLSNGIIKNNTLFSRGFISRSKVMIDLSNGKNNSVSSNSFAVFSNERGYINTAFFSGLNDSWGPNYYSDKEGFGIPKE